MRGNVLVALVVAAAYMSAIAPALGQGVKKSAKKSLAEGVWKGRQGQEPWTLKLTVKGQDLSGTLTREIEVREDLRNKPDQKTAAVTVDVEAGKINGNNVEFECDMVGPEGQRFRATFKGVVKQDSLELRPQPPASGGPFTLKRSAG